MKNITNIYYQKGINNIKKEKDYLNNMMINMILINVYIESLIT